MELRKAELSELDEVMDVYEDGRRALADLGIDQWQHGRPSRAMLEADIVNGELFACVEGDAVLGYVMFSLRGDASYDSLEGSWLSDGDSENPDYGVVHRLVADSRTGRRGVASFLMGQAEQLARAAGMRGVRLDTHPGNVPMHRLLAKLGYTKCGAFHLVGCPEPVTERYAYEKLV